MPACHGVVATELLFPERNRDKMATVSMPEASAGNPALEIDKIFRACVKLEGSDLHLKVGQPPIVRIKG